MPEKLTQMRQWCVSNLIRGADGGIVQETKRPLRPADGLHASVTDPRGWTTFKAALAAVREGKGTDVGIVITPDDDLAVFDLDDKKGDESIRKRNDVIAERAWKRGHYVERSSSKTGYHILFRGEPRPSRRADSVEYYSRDRYVILTFDGPVVEPKRDDDGMWGQLYDSLFPPTVEETSTLVESPPVEPDAAVLKRFLSGVQKDRNKELFFRPLEGDQSTLDHSLVERLALFTPSDEQVRRLFYASVRGKRDKVLRRGSEYLDRSLRFARSAHSGLQRRSTPR